jgi:hypothetical protein
LAATLASGIYTVAATNVCEVDACATWKASLLRSTSWRARSNDNQESAALVRQIDDRVAELKRLILYWAKR